jgi:hypothetical protein
MFAFTYIGVKVDNSINILTLMFAFTYHRMVLLVLAPGKSPKFVQLYIFSFLPWLIGDHWFSKVDSFGIYASFFLIKYSRDICDFLQHSHWHSCKLPFWYPFTFLCADILAQCSQPLRAAIFFLCFPFCLQLISGHLVCMSPSIHDLLSRCKHELVLGLLGELLLLLVMNIMPSFC